MKKCDACGAPKGVRYYACETFGWLLIPPVFLLLCLIRIVEPWSEQNVIKDWFWRHGLLGVGGFTFRLQSAYHAVRCKLPGPLWDFPETSSRNGDEPWRTDRT